MKNQIFCIFIALILVFYNQCGKKHNFFKKYYKERNQVKKFPKIENWDFKTFSQKRYYYPPTIYSINDKYIFVCLSESADRDLIHIYNIKDGKFINSFAKKGKGTRRSNTTDDGTVPQHPARFYKRT